jgi:hypothetical protein
MFGKEELEVTISPKGEVQIEAKGFKGGSCLKATKRLEEALGIEKARKLKVEFHEELVVADKVKVGQ